MRKKKNITPDGTASPADTRSQRDAISSRDTASPPVSTGNSETKRETTRIEDKPDTDNSPLRELIDSLDETHAPLRGMLTYAAVARSSAEELALVFHPDYKFHMDLMDQYGEVTDILADAAHRAFGSPCKISYCMGDQNAPRAVIDQDILGKRLQEARKIELAGSRPEVSKVLKMFRGKIREVVLKDTTRRDSVDGDELEDDDNVE